MKKIIGLTLMALVLTGCSSQSKYLSSLSDGDTVIATIDGEAVSKDDIYHYYLENYGASQVLSEALGYVAEQEVTDQDAIDSTLQETVDLYEEYAGTDFDSYAISLGYDSGDQYKEEALLPSVMQQLLLEKYIDDNFDTLRSSYEVKYIKTIIFNTEIEAEAFIAETSNEDFDGALEDNSGTDVGIITNEDSSVDSNIIALLSDFTEDGIYQTPITLTDETTAVVYVYNTELDDTTTQEVKDTLESSSGISVTAENYYLDQYEFTINEPLIETSINNTLATD